MSTHSGLAHKVSIYQPNQYVKDLVNTTRIVLLVGISGAGKDSVKHQLLQSPDYHHIVSHTTRPPRENHGVLEQDGVDYHFISRQTAEDMLDNHGFVEAKIYSDNIYGTSVGEIQLAHDENRIAITDIEVQGVEEYMKISTGVKAIFIMPPSYKEWQRRLLGRYGDNHTDHTEDIHKRMLTARDELQRLLKADHFYIVVNNSLQDTIKFIDKLAHEQISYAPIKQRARDVKVVRQMLAHLEVVLAKYDLIK